MTFAVIKTSLFLDTGSSEASERADAAKSRIVEMDNISRKVGQAAEKDDGNERNEKTNKRLIHSNKESFDKPNRRLLYMSIINPAVKVKHCIWNRSLVHT